MFDVFYDDSSSEDKGSVKLNVLIAVGIFILIGTLYQEVTGSSAADVLSGNTVSQLLSLHM